MKCSSCSQEMPDERIACPSCGTAVADQTAPTFMKPQHKDNGERLKGSSGHRSSQSPTRPVSFDSIDDARFVPGTMVAERYRIVGLLGRGGMGEVYRADDLKLGQPVALKFLPERLLNDGAALSRFHREVRVARQVSHRNVCRVYDIGEVAGQHFLSMEFIKGEELASLLRRIGRLPPDKAVEIARQICAGLAAAHSNGVLHRDLKPSNVMIDANGDARITDFGLAGLAEEFREDERHAGTPAYMAPEQLNGEAATIKSDIYSLGLVLYEIFTGKRAFEANSLAELIKLRRSDTTPTNPSSHVKEIDPVAERVILRCIEREPEKRPASALQVAAALPGGDPLAAALAAGETPSPEMVAAAPKEGSLRPAVAATLLAASLLSLVLFLLLSEKLLMTRHVPLEKSPEVLADHAATFIKKLGYTDAPVDTAYSFEYEPEYYRYVEENDKSQTRWDHAKSGRPALIYFWYRQSQRYLEPQAMKIVTETDPSPLLLSGMASVRLDTLGRLMQFQIVPPQVDDASNASPPADWSALFAEAGLDMTKFTPTESRWTPPVYSDTRAAWEGFLPEQPQVALRVEAASYRGKPVYFELVGPWHKPTRVQPYESSAAIKRILMFVFVIFMTILLTSIWLAKRNLELGRGDRKGAFKMAIFVLVASVVGWLIGASHLPTFYGELWLLFLIVSSALFQAAVLWLFYIALEPYVRRRTPHRIISWSRLLAGGWRDPLVGRDVLIAVILGIWMNLFSMLAELTGRWLGFPPDLFTVGHTQTLLGARGIAPVLLMGQISTALLHGLGFTFLLLLLSLLLRGEWRASVGAWLLFTMAFVIAGHHPFALMFLSMIGGVYIFVAKQFGMLAVAVAQFVFFMGEFYPYTLDFSVWYASTTIFAMMVIVGLAIYGFYTSLAGEPLFREGILKE